MSSPIPKFYRVALAIIDLGISPITAITTLFAPQLLLNAYTPTYTSPPAHETIFIMDQSAGFFLMAAFLQLFLFRSRPDDLLLWRAFESSLLLVDSAYVFGYVKLLSTNDRLGMSAWRLDDWGNWGVIIAIVGVRVAFLAQIGFREQTKGKGKKA